MKHKWENSPRKAHIDIIKEALSLKDAKILDVGCGIGNITRALTKMGAKVIGLDPSPIQLKRARDEPIVGNEIYIEGNAENLPSKDRSMDMILFINSFHNVPRQYFPEAVSEAHRALKPGGKLFIAEPIPDGPQFEVSRLINDETEIRTAAYEFIRSIPKRGFTEGTESIYLTENRHANFESFKEHSISINARRLEVFNKYEIEIRKTFETFSTKKNGVFTFENPIRTNIFIRD